MADINIIKKYIIKIIILATIAISIIALSPVGASAAWKQDDTGSLIGGCFVNSSGVYTNTITASGARQLILKEDGNYISKITDDHTRLSTDYREYSAGNLPSGIYWNIPKEPYYEFYVHVYDYNEEVFFDICEYLVGKESKNVYIAPNQGGMPIYQIKNNLKVNTFKYIGEGISYEWR